MTSKPLGARYSLQLKCGFRCAVISSCAIANNMSVGPTSHVNLFLRHSNHVPSALITLMFFVFAARCSTHMLLESYLARIKTLMFSSVPRLLMHFDVHLTIHDLEFDLTIVASLVVREWWSATHLQLQCHRRVPFGLALWPLLSRLLLPLSPLLLLLLPLLSSLWQPLELQ